MTSVRVRQRYSRSMGTEAAHLAEELLAFMASTRVPWFTPLVRALEGVDAKLAERDPGPRLGLNSIWAVVNPCPSGTSWCSAACEASSRRTRRRATAGGRYRRTAMRDRGTTRAKSSSVATPSSRRRCATCPTKPWRSHGHPVAPTGGSWFTAFSTTPATTPPTSCWRGGFWVFPSPDERRRG